MRDHSGASLFAAERYCRGTRAETQIRTSKTFNLESLHAVDCTGNRGWLAPRKLCDTLGLDHRKTGHPLRLNDHDPIMPSSRTRPTCSRSSTRPCGREAHRSAAKNIKAWLTEPRYAEYADEVAAHVNDGKWQVLDDVFWTVIPFGTGGRRGRCTRSGRTRSTTARSARRQGLADYVKATLGPGRASCGIAYDTRHKSDHFARLCAEIMTAAGFTVYFLQGYRSTPELSFLVRDKNARAASWSPPATTRRATTR